MAKFNLGLSGLGDAGVAQGREAWAGELPPTGTYTGILKIMQIGTIGAEAKNAGKGKISIGVELKADGASPSKKYDGFIAWHNLNLIDSAKPYINQFLLALTDGEESSLAKLQVDFENNIILDERRVHVQRIGKLKVDSPEGEIPVKVSLRNSPYTNTKTNVTTQTVSISSFLINDNGEAYAGGSSSGPVESEVEEETVSVDLEPEDDSDVAPEEDMEPEDLVGQEQDADNLLPE